MTCVIDLASRRRMPTSETSLAHPAGIKLPFNETRDAELVGPVARAAICSGSYRAEMVQLLPSIVRRGDRVLVIGTDLGVVSTLIAKSRGVNRVLVVEPDTDLVSYLRRVHIANSVSWVETVNATPVARIDRHAPFEGFINVTPLRSRRDDWRAAPMAPPVDLNLIIAEEKISLIVCGCPTVAGAFLGGLDLGPVDRIAISPGDSERRSCAEPGIRVALAERGFAIGACAPALLFERAAGNSGRVSWSAESRRRTGT